VNFHDTHFPYHHRGIESLVSDRVVPRAQIAPERVADLWEMYANTAANVDAAIGRVLAAVERRTGRSPAVVVTSDHGESLYEEGFLGHGYALNEVQTRVPFVVAGLPMAVTEPFGQVELRDALWRALSVAEDGAPTTEADPAKAVFQYLGSSLSRPRAIGARSGQGLVQFDFRTTRFTAGAGGAVPEAKVPDEWRAPAAQLIRQWEAMVVASTAGAPRR
jgi:hypothetical protein